MKTYLIVFFVLTGLSFSYGQITASFAKNYESGMGGESYCFNINGTYIYLGTTDLDKVVDKGTYKKIGDTLILTSYVQMDDLLKVSQHKISSDSTYFSFHLFSGEKFFLTTLIINDSLKFEITDTVEILKFKNGFVKHFIFHSMFLPWQLKEKVFQIESNNLIEILMDDTKGFRRAFFNNDKFIYRKTSIQAVDDKKYSLTYQPNFECKE